MTSLIISAIALNLLIVIGLWLLQLRTKNAAIIDVFWPISILIYVTIFLSTQPLKNPLILTLQILFAIWALRLSSHLYFSRIHKHSEESRYLQLRDQWGKNQNRNLLILFSSQALFNFLLAAPILLMAPKLTTPFGLEVAGVIIMALSFLLEWVSDAQLKAFKRGKNRKPNEVCEVGLWGYSRHPNYFFEFLFWVGFAMSIVVSPMGYIALLSPLLMLMTLYKVTGIPATEEAAVRSKGAQYTSYQRRVSPFIPWFPKYRSEPPKPQEVS
jgi:steroid 5-alpha reductase family enzyme